MSNFQIPIVNQAQTVSSTQCLTGCLYQIVQSPGPQGRNVLNLIPVLKSKDNTVPVSASTIPNAGTLNIQQPIRFALPSAVSNVSLPCQVNAPLIQQLGTGKYVITSQKSPVDTSKTIRVDSTLSALQGTNVVLEKSGLNLPSTSKPGTQTILMMNAKSPSVPVKTVPFLPSGHGLQIPAHAEVKTVPASSLPFSIQQRILPQLNQNDATKMPSVIYVSPVNTVKTSSNKMLPMPLPKPNNILTPIMKQSSLIPTLPLTSQSNKTEAPKGPMKWVVQESTESSCIVPVTSSNNTASKLLKMMSGTKVEDINLSNTSTSKMVQIKDNALVVCNNKIYLLTKQGAELRGTDNIKTEPSIKTTAPTDQKVPSIVPAESVLSKNVSPPTPKQTVNSSRAPLFSPNADTAAKSRICTSSKTNGNEPEVIYIDDDDDESVQKPQAPLRNRPDKLNFIKLDIPLIPPVFGSKRKDDHVQIQPNKTNSNNLRTPTAPLHPKRKDDLLHNQPNKTSSINLRTPTPLDPKRKDDQLHNQTNKASSINVRTPTAPQDYGSKRKDNQLHNQTDKTSSINVCTAIAPPAFGSDTKGDLVRSQPNKPNSIKVCAATTPSDCGPNIKEDQVREWQSMKIAEEPVRNISDDQSLRVQFGLVKKEKIILSRIPLLGRDSRRSSSSSYLREDVMAHTESLDKRKSTFSETVMDSSSKRRKSDDPNLNENTPESNCSASTSSSTAAVQASVSSAHVTQTSGQRQCSSPVPNENEMSTNHESATEMYPEPTDSDSYFVEQNVVGHFGEVSAPTQRFLIENSAYPDETTKDEKIQRLKEVLKEREQALEALRRLKRP